MLGVESENGKTSSVSTSVSFQISICLRTQDALQVRTSDLLDSDKCGLSDIAAVNGPLLLTRGDVLIEC